MIKDRQSELQENPIQSLWVGYELSTMETMSLKSFMKHGHTVHLYTYNPVSGVPDGVLVLDASEILPATKIFKYKDHPSYSGFSNMFRYELLLKKGGWWSDLDMICLRALEFEEEYVFASQQQTDGSEVVTTGLIKAPKGSDILRAASEVCMAVEPEKLKWGQTGPLLLQRLVTEFRFERYARRAQTFCPIPYFSWTQAIEPTHPVLGSDVYAVHLWNEMWRRANRSRDDEYPKDSLYQRLKAMYL